MCVGVADRDTVGEFDALDDPGNWFAPFSLRQVFAAAETRVKTISFAVFCDRAPLVRTVRCRTVANTLSIGFVVRRWSQCSAGKS